MTQSRLLLAAVFLVSFCAFTTAQQKNTLEYKFEKGKTYRYHQVMKGITTQEMMGREMKVDNGSCQFFRIP